MLGNVFYLNSGRDALAIRETAAIEKNVVVIGDDLIALEAAAALTEAKCKVTLMGGSRASGVTGWMWIVPNGSPTTSRSVA